MTANYGNEGLNQSQKLHFDNIGHVHLTHVESPLSNVTLTLQLCLPLFLTQKLWRRYKYNIANINTTLEVFNPRHLWQLATLYGILPNISAIKLSFETPESMVFGSKAIVIKKLVAQVKKQFQYDKHTCSALDLTRLDHVPPLPVCTINEHVWQKWANLIPKQQPPALLDVLHFSEVVCWNGILLVPLWIENLDALFCVRVITSAVFEQSHRNRYPCLSTQPLRIQTPDNSYAGVEECVFFMPERKAETRPPMCEKNFLQLAQ